MKDIENEEQSLDFKDRKLLVVIFGIFHIFLGAICVFMVLGAILGMVESAKNTGEHMSASEIISLILFYLTLATWFIWMGIGSIKAKRWARALILTTSWLWLVCGLIGFTYVVIYMPKVINLMARDEQTPSEVVAATKYFIIGFTLLLFVIIPGVLILSYRGRNVKATFEFRDQKIRWTDKCPLPILAVSLLFGFGATSMLLRLLYHCKIRLFGFIISGIPGAAVILVIMLFLVFLTWGTYKLKMTAWWGAVALVIIGSISGIITFLRVGFMEFYGLVQNYDFLEVPTAVYSSLIMVLFLGYLMYTRKFFAKDI